MPLPRMRTVKEAIAELKKNDPHTAMTEHALRVLIKTGEIPIVQCGRRFLLNLDTLMEYLSLPVKEKAPIEQPAGIRRIEV